MDEFLTLMGLGAVSPQSLRIGDRYSDFMVNCSIADIYCYKGVKVARTISTSGQRYTMFVPEIAERINKGIITNYHPTTTPLQAMWLEYCFNN